MIIKNVSKETRSLLVFFAITLLWTWSCGGLAYLFREDLFWVNFFFLLGGSAPSIVGYQFGFRTVK